ncbi:MAG: DNA polymerase IV [Myxococcales bacterium]|nr:DNA polymerase IV [Myxococcales bacterium]
MTSAAPIRRIIHVDMDAFYASVEQRDDPTLRGRPVIVGGSPDGRGVVASASYEARSAGVRSAMPASRARRLCPAAIFLRPRFDAYLSVSREIRAIFRRYTELVEPLALDEAYLDVTQNRLDEPYATPLARSILAAIRSELDLPASAGVGPNKFIAKLASDWDKPNGLVVVPPQRVEAFLRDMPIERLWGVGPATAGRIRELGLETIGELARFSLTTLERVLGSYARTLQDLARGIDNRPVVPRRVAKSRGAERTFAVDLFDLEAMQTVLADLADEVSSSLREIERPGRTVTLKLRFADFRTVTRAVTLPRYVIEREAIRAAAFELLGRIERSDLGVRLLGISVSNLRRDDDPQLHFPFYEEGDVD